MKPKNRIEKIMIHNDSMDFIKTVIRIVVNNKTMLSFSVPSFKNQIQKSLT